jgi:hypothetical protein
MTDPAVHDPDPRVHAADLAVHDRLILVFTMSDPRVHDRPAPAGFWACRSESLSLAQHHE